VGQAYAHAFLIAILPELSDFIKKSGVDVKIPITTNEVDMPHYDCGLVEGLPRACVYLKTGDRFWYERGQTVAFDAADAYRWPAPNSAMEDKPLEKFFGPVNMSANEALAVVRKAVDQLGWTAQDPRLKTRPEVVPPVKYGTNYFAHYFFNWWPDDGSSQIAVAEVNATTRKLVSLDISGRANPSIWREPPKIDVPMELQMTEPEVPPSAKPSNQSIPLPALPPGMPLPGR
jgi:hypothetical protein